MKILLVIEPHKHRYMRHMVEYMGDITIINQEEYLSVNQDEYGVLIYNTFADETHPTKFDWELISKTDEKYRTFKGLKILLDSYDNGTRDGFARFHDFTTPRIKINPSYDFMKTYNIIMTIPYICYSFFCNPQEDRPNKLLCAMNMKGMPEGRRTVREKIKDLNPITDFLPIQEHAKRLCKTLINIVPTGAGDSSFSHANTLASGALLMAEENIKDIKLLPFVDLDDGVHFVTYNLDNIQEKLNDLFENPQKIEEIRLAGLEAFKVGYDYKRSAEQLLEFIHENNRK